MDSKKKQIIDFIKNKKSIDENSVKDIEEMCQFHKVSYLLIKIKSEGRYEFLLILERNNKIIKTAYFYNFGIVCFEEKEHNLSSSYNFFFPGYKFEEMLMRIICE